MQILLGRFAALFLVGAVLKNVKKVSVGRMTFVTVQINQSTVTRNVEIEKKLT